MWSNRINSLWLHKLYHWPVAILYKLSDAGFDMGRIGAGCAYKCLPLNAVTWQGREGFFGGTPVCLVPSPWGRRLSRVHSSSPRWPSAVLGRVSMGPRGRKPASPLPWGSRRFTSVPKLIIALRYGIKTIRALVLDSSALGMEVINRGRWWGWRRTLQGMRGINYVIMIRVCDHRGSESRLLSQLTSAVNEKRRWSAFTAVKWRLYLYSINGNALKMAYLYSMVL